MFTSLPELEHYVSTSIPQFAAGRVISFRERGITGDTMLHWVVEFEPSDVAALSYTKLLVDAGTDVNAEGDMSERPLHRAARRGRLDVCKLLVMSGAEKTAKDDWGKRPSDWAYENGFDDLARYLAS
jgi:ankyrin repeat protein